MLLRLVILFVLGYLAYSFIKGIMRGSSHEEMPGKRADYSKRDNVRDHEDMVHDEVCDTYIPVSSAISVESNGKSLYFCSEACREKFSSKP